MRRRPLFKSAVMIIAVMFMLTFFAGCGEVEDYYGAASDYIEVSHPDPVEQDGGTVDIDTPSDTDKGGSGVIPSPGDDSSEPGGTVDTPGDNPVDVDTPSGDTPSGGSNINDKPIVGDDQGRAVDVP